MSSRPPAELSPMEQFRLLPQKERERRLAGLTDEQKAGLAWQWFGWRARPSQCEPEGDWRIWLLLAGRGYGKTRTGAEWVRESVRESRYVNLISPTADDARDVMVEGESGILAICPRWERPEYQPSKRKLQWPNGATSLIFTADEPERLRGKQHERFWADELASWRYPDAWDQALLGLRLGPDPRAVVTTTPKPNRLVRDLVNDPTCVITKGSTYDNVANLAPAFADQIIRRYEGTRMGRQELEAELLLDEGLAYTDFRERIHVVRSFVLPNDWERFECMDFGSNNPTAWLLVATDYDGNLVVADEYYSPGLVEEHAAAIRRLRETSWWATDERGEKRAVSCLADPSIRNKLPLARDGRVLSVESLFSAEGVSLSLGNNDRQFGFVTIAGLLRPVEGRLPPVWATHLPAGSPVPRLFVMESCPNLIAQLRDAPLEEPGKHLGGEAIGKDWEGAHGHAHAALRYGVTSLPGASERPVVIPDDPRQDFLDRYVGELERSDRSLIPIE